MKPLDFMVVLLVALFLSVVGKSSGKHNRSSHKNTKKVIHLAKPNNRLNYEILSKRVKTEYTGEKRQFPYHINEAEHGYEKVPPTVDNNPNLARDNVNPNDLPQSDGPRHIDEDSSQVNEERNQESRPMVQRQDPSIERAGGTFNKDMDNPTPQHIYEDSFQGPNHDPAMSFHQAADLRFQQQDSPIDNIAIHSDGQTYNAPQHFYDSHFGPNQNGRSFFQGPPPEPSSSIVNPSGPLNIRIIKKFFPVPIVHRIPKPIPVTDTRVVPIPVHQRRFHYVPQPFVQPFSRNPDVHLSYLHLEKRANPCRHGGIIVQSPGGYTCLCRKAYKGKHCEEEDKCYPFPCKNEGDCLDHGTHYECKCSRRFKGINCEVEDKCSDHPCKNGATCTQQLQSDIICTCRSGYKGPFCQDLDYCLPNPCRNGGICDEENQEASCKCTPMFKGSRCQVPKMCSVNLCRNGGICREEKPDNPCECATGFTGDYCTENVCQPNPCKNDGVCYPLRGDYNATWYGACTCRDSYKGDWCQIPNPCASNPSPCIHGICYDAYTNSEQVDLSVDGLSCQCYGGYFGTYCGEKKCDHCDTNARCLDGVKCSCNDGYQGDGHLCKKIPELCVPNPCENGGRCRLDENTFECKCAPGFKGKTCRDKSPCSSLFSPCKNGGTCIELSGDDYSCICANDWKGKDCSYNSTNLCFSSPCLNGGICKVSEDGKSWYCVCRGSRFKPPDCACVCPANAHDRSERNLTCDNPGGICVCPQEFKHDHDHDVCVDEDEDEDETGKGETPCDPNPCKNGGICKQLPNSRWKCNCTEGWKGKTCEEEAPIKPGRTPCLPNPCYNNGRCITVRESYDCICDQQFTGPHCEVDRCIKCHPVNALCNRGECLCKPGYVGNGYQCVPPPKKQENVCIKCHPIYAVCLNNGCQCKNNFVGDGYQCTPVKSGTTLTKQVVPWF